MIEHDPSTAPETPPTGAGRSHERVRRLAALLAMSGESFRVALKSPHAAVRHGLRQLVTFHVDNARLVTLDDDADLVLYDLAELRESGAEELQRARSSTEGIILVVSLDDDADLAASAVSLGVDGYLCLKLSEEEWLDAVGAIVLERLARDQLSHAGPGNGAVSELRLEDVDLTDRELDVLSLIAEGRSNLEVAEALSVGANSVKTYIRTAYRKIGASSRSQAVSWTLRSGLMTNRRPRD